VDPKGQFPRDPRDLDLAARSAWCQRMADAQQQWLRRLAPLAEIAPATDFPAFLLGLPPFQGLAQRLQNCSTRSGTPTETLDELERFLDAFANYLRTDRDEIVFEQNTRRAG
jgi:hypothetical protein